MQRVRLSPVIGLLVAICGFPPPQSVAQAQSDPALEQKLQAGRNALGSRQWIVAIRAFQEASYEAPGPGAEFYLGLAAAYRGQYRDTDKKLVNLFTGRAYPAYLVIHGDGVITNPIVGANPEPSVVNQLGAILNDHATAPKPELKPSSPAILLLYEPV